MISENTAAVVIDMQPGFVDERPGVLELTANIVKVVEHFAKRKLPTVVLEYDPPTFGRTLEPIRDSVGKVPQSEYFHKHYDNGFTNEDLEPWLKDHDVKDVLLMGVNATACVQETGKGALACKLEVLTSEDLINDPEDWDSDPSKWYKKNGVFFPSYPELLVAPNPVRRSRRGAFLDRFRTSYGWLSK